MGTTGLEPQAERCSASHWMWTLRTAKRKNRISNAILPEVELFKVCRFSKDPWGLICSIAANQPRRPKTPIFFRFYRDHTSCQSRSVLRLVFEFPANTFWWRKRNQPSWICLWDSFYWIRQEAAEVTWAQDCLQQLRVLLGTPCWPAPLPLFQQRVHKCVRCAGDRSTTIRNTHPYCLT